MEDIFALEFTYKLKNYQALIRTKRKPDCSLYYITIMNGELERLLFGYHVVTAQDGRLQYEVNEVRAIHELKHCIVEALEEKLKQEESLLAVV